ncbi:MAG: diphthamide synthesis protein [Candidatus Nanoarchaeia archaeon]|nr:diphthamide synthesis protein [Candidatus Nanoarchaeia archaeon]
MEVLFVECRLKDWVFREDAKENILKEIKNYESVTIVSTVQYLDIIGLIEDFLKENNKKVIVSKSLKHAKYKGQVLGCDAEAALKNKADVVIYIGDGMFHPIAVMMESDTPVLAFNPKTYEIKKITDENIKIYRMRKALAFDKLKHSDKIGILVSIKPGQYNPDVAVETKNKFEKKGKKAFIFVFDELQIDSLINFPDVESWVNTACPRMALEDAFRFRQSILNYDEIEWQNL